ncbi:MAG: hypothetical protein QM692_12870 [Thermomicrobiales bacterium]
MPVIAFRDLLTPTALDTQRHRATVWVRADADSPEISLGDVWRSPATQQWRFTRGARTRHPDDDVPGYATREEAARALLRFQRETAEAEAHAALERVNTLRTLMGEQPFPMEQASR